MGEGKDLLTVGGGRWMRCSFPFLAVLLTLMAAVTAWGDEGSAAETGTPTAAAVAADGAMQGEIPYGEVADAERRAVERRLESPHWPFRVFALMRLERYSGGELEALIRGRLADEAWQVRSFAVRQAARMGVTARPSDIEGENDGRVIRTALQCGVELDSKRIERGVRRLMRGPELDDRILGIEIAAASGDEGLRRDATQRFKRMIRDMNEMVSVRISRRLARLAGLDRPPIDAVAWREWLGVQVRNYQLPSTGQLAAGADHAEKPLVAKMDMETFSRLMEYLDSLRNQDLDMAVVMDATTSMLPMINEARAGVDSLILFFNDISDTMRLAFIAYRDFDNEPLFEMHPFTADTDSIRSFLFRLRITGGADLPEAVLDGLTACKRLEWSEGSTRRVILVGDARPHDGDLFRAKLLMEKLTGMGIVVHAVHVPMYPNPAYLRLMGASDAARYRREVEMHNRLTDEAFEEIAQLGGGRMATIREAEEFVPAVMHLTIEEVWWPAFDEFYELFLELCR